MKNPRNIIISIVLLLSSFLSGQCDGGVDCCDDATGAYAAFGQTCDSIINGFAMGCDQAFGGISIAAECPISCDNCPFDDTDADNNGVPDQCDAGGATSHGCCLPDFNLHLTESGKVYYNASETLGGFQFTVEGATPLSVSGGDAANAQYTINSNSETNMVLGYSGSGTTIAAGCGILIEIELDGTPTGLTSIMITDPTGGSVYDFVDYVYVAPVPGCTDPAACNYNADANTNDGSCDSTIPDGYCDCAGTAQVPGYTCLGFPLNFVFNSSTQLNQYFFSTVTLDGDTIDTNDWVGAFSPSGVCVGSFQWDLDSCGGGVCGVQVLGDDGSDYTEGYMNDGEIPTFQIYDAATNSYSPATPSEDVPWALMELPFIDALQGCSGGVVLDECGVCGGDGIANGECDCDGNVNDCDSVCGGDAVEDMCGECNNDPTDDCPMDCAGNFDGSAIVNECDVCLCEGETAQEGFTCATSDPCVEGCDGVWENDGSELVVDACSECGGDNPNSCLEDGESCSAANECDADACDACGECNGDNPNSCLEDGESCSAANECDADACDACGECGNDNPSSCLADGSSCSASNECEADDCDACGECGGDNPDSCLANFQSCSAANECLSDSCDACGECGNDNPTSCLADGESCSAANECSADECDACGECGDDNPDFCLEDFASCDYDHDCLADECDACGECGDDLDNGNNVDCLADGEDCDDDNECAYDSCDICGLCGNDGDQGDAGYGYYQCAGGTWVCEPSDCQDSDLDNVDDDDDTDIVNPYVCSDTDEDGCDDCGVSGFYDPTNDGHDFDGDGLCDYGSVPVSDDCGDDDDTTTCYYQATRDMNNSDTGDADDDNDGILDVDDDDDDNDGVCDGSADGDDCVANTVDGTDNDEINNNFVCGDSDSDGCEDCVTGHFDPNNDGWDYDGDGQCDVGINGDGSYNLDGGNDWYCTQEFTTTLGIHTDTYCYYYPITWSAVGNWQYASDGDDDDDNDGSVDTADWEDNDEMECSDDDSDTCDDCSQNTSDLSDPDGGGHDVWNDGTDYDNAENQAMGDDYIDSMCDGGYDFEGKNHMDAFVGPYGDVDDDNDGHPDYGLDGLTDDEDGEDMTDDDLCPQGFIGEIDWKDWENSGVDAGTDYDQDGCQSDSDTDNEFHETLDEDWDDDGDGVNDIDEGVNQSISEYSLATFNCVLSYPPTYQRNIANDHDGDGCLSGNGDAWTSSFLGYEDEDNVYNEMWKQHTNVEDACDHTPVTHDDDGDNDWYCDYSDCLDGNGDPIDPTTLSAGDPWCYCEDNDDDNDGAKDGDDNNDTNNEQCSDDDGDGCDDCWSGMYDTANDGDDYDGDGLCDDVQVGLDGDGDEYECVEYDPMTGIGCDLDDDNDGIADEDEEGQNMDDNDGVPHDEDTDPFDPFICSDTDEDGCDDCSLRGFYDPTNDGHDFDGDGLCDYGSRRDNECEESTLRTDYDGDGVCDPEPHPPECILDCVDIDEVEPNGDDPVTMGEFCGWALNLSDDCMDDCDDGSIAYVDGLFTAWCAAGDDGEVTQTASALPACHCPNIDDRDNAATGDPDDDNDGEIDTSDPDDDNDGVNDDIDNDLFNNNFICGDSDNDGCEDCSSGISDVGGDGFDFDDDGLCDQGFGGESWMEDNGDGEATHIHYNIWDGVSYDSGDAWLAVGFWEYSGTGDDDDDNDNSSDDDDDDDNNRFICSDTDQDSCQDCIWGSYDPSNDGDDYELDGLCDAGDEDDDNDGVVDGNDVDHQTGDDCSQGMIGVGDDYDNDGCQDDEDGDQDGDSVLNDDDECPESYPATSPDYLCEDGNLEYSCTADDYDGDGCLANPNENWVEDDNTADGNTWHCITYDECADGDQYCGCEDDDEDNDGSLDGADNNDANEFECSDDDGDTCDDCSSGTLDTSNDGDDSDGDGLCNAGDAEPNCAAFNENGDPQIEDACGVCGGDGLDCDLPAGFAYNQSSSQAFYYVGSVKDIYGVELDTADWVGIFNGDVCVGYRRWDTDHCASGLCDIAAMGESSDTWEDNNNDNHVSNTAGYLNESDVPTFRIWDASEGEFFDVTPIKEGTSYQDYGFKNYEIFGIDELMVTKDYRITLHADYNLISFYNLPEDNRVENVFNGLSDNIEYVIGEGTSAQYNTNWIVGSTFSDGVDISSGYWVRMDSDIDETGLDLNGSGFPYHLNREYNFHAGPNLVSIPSMGTFNIAEALPDDERFTDIIGQGASATKVNGNWQGSLTTFEELRGYWIFTNGAIDFTFNVNPEDAVAGSMSRVIAQTQMTERPEDLKFIQSSEQAFYYVDEEVMQEEMVEIGDWFVSFCGSTMAGSRQYLGEATDIPVMGYTGHHSTAGYCEFGDTPQFKLFKPETSKMVDLYAVTPTWASNGILFLDNVTDAKLIPNEFAMVSAYPNPFNPVTNIGFEISTESMVQISIFDLKGQEVETLVNEWTSPGQYSINWNAGNTASGVYFVHLTAAGEGFTPISQIQKLMLIK